MPSIRARSALRPAAVVLLAIAATGCLNTRDGRSACRASSDCGADGLACRDGRCVTATCADSSECDPSQACSAGVCQPRPACQVSSSTIGFCDVPVTMSTSRDLTVSNPSSTAWRLVLSAFEWDAGPVSAWSFAQGFSSGEFVVPAAGADGTPGKLVVPIVFQPLWAGSYAAMLPIASPDAVCPPAIALSGSGVDDLLVCEPRTEIDTVRACRVDFGSVGLGAKASREATLRNFGDRDVTVTLGQLTGAGTNAEFGIEAAQHTFLVPANATPTPIDLSFMPHSLGPHSARLTFTTDAPGQLTGYIDLVGSGGGPIFAAEPAALDFAEVGVGMFQVRRLTLANVGDDVPDTTDDNLLFGDPYKPGTDPPEISGPGASQFSVEWPPDGYTRAGLAAGQDAAVRIKFKPSGAGAVAAVLTIPTNDSRGLHQVNLSGTGVALPACDYEITPPALDFGVVEPNASATLSFSIRNRSQQAQDTCFVSMVQPALETDREFSLPGGALGVTAPVVLHGGESLEVTVQFAPTEEATYSGAIELFVSNPDAPTATVALTGIVEHRCLQLVPSTLDFGRVGVGCRSRQRIVALLNTCTTSVNVTQIDVTATQFSITKKPALPVTIAAGGSTEVGVMYLPVAEGLDVGTVAITVAGAAHPIVAILSGAGALSSLKTDVFTPPELPKTDILLVVDNGPSMADKQAALASNFASFAQFFTRQRRDYHVAVTTTDVTPSGAAGRLLPLTGSNPRVITPSTPNAAQVFAQNVAVGTSGSAATAPLAAASLALSNPLLAGHNAGFYRSDAQLAVLVISDNVDHDPQSLPVSYYDAFFLNLKGSRRRNDFTFSAIIPLQSQAPAPSSGCSYASSAAGQDARVLTLVQRTGGLLDEICNPDWSRTLEKLWPACFGCRQSYSLSNVPDMSLPDPIAVAFDGQPFPQFGPRGEKRWDYNSASNALEFDPLAMPSPGTTIAVTYRVACL